VGPGDTGGHHHRQNGQAGHPEQTRERAVHAWFLPSNHRRGAAVRT
jgi:hypothetical protein